MKKVLMLFMLIGFVQASFYRVHDKGWHWYEEIPAEEEQSQKKIEDKAHETAKPPSQRTEKEKIAAYREELENRLAAALINPTSEKIKAYQEMQKDMVDRSKNFSDGWMKNVFLNAELDSTIASPVNQKAIHLRNDLEKKQTTETIKNLSKEYGLFFFFSGKCEYCHEFAPIVKKFSEQYGWQVLAITLDGGTLEDFPNSQPDNGLFEQWQVQVMPSLYAVNPNTGHVIPVAHGMTSIDEMENRIATLASKRQP
jgi:conjugal transfer pilus assembly protein TraF